MPAYAQVRACLPEQVVILHLRIHFTFKRAMSIILRVYITFHWNDKTNNLPVSGLNCFDLSRMREPGSEQSMRLAGDICISKAILCVLIFLEQTVLKIMSPEVYWIN